MTISIVIKSGLVQSVYNDAGHVADVEIIDLDVLDARRKKLERRSEELDNAAMSNGPVVQVYP